MIRLSVRRPTDSSFGPEDRISSTLWGVVSPGRTLRSVASGLEKPGYISSYESHGFLTDVSVDQSYKIKSVRQTHESDFEWSHSPRIRDSGGGGAGRTIALPLFFAWINNSPLARPFYLNANPKWKDLTFSLVRALESRFILTTIINDYQEKKMAALGGNPWQI